VALYNTCPAATDEAKKKKKKKKTFGPGPQINSSQFQIGGEKRLS
jgi:hypothetical protein